MVGAGLAARQLHAQEEPDEERQRDLMHPARLELFRADEEHRDEHHQRAGNDLEILFPRTSQQRAQPIFRRRSSRAWSRS